MHNVRDAQRIVAVLLVCWATVSTARATPVMFTPDYSLEGANEGFNDPTLGAARKSAFEHALGVMSGVFDSRYSGETYKVRAQFNVLAGNATSAVLGSAVPVTLFSGFANPVESESRFYPAALASHRHTADLDGATPEIDVQFNSAVDDGTVLGSVNWYYGTDANSGGHIDLVTVALHEIGHGIGFTGFLQSNGAYSMQMGTPLISIFDHFMNTSSSGGAKLTSLNNPQRSAEVTGDDLWWDGALGTAANGGTRPKLHAPGTYAAGSSLYHLDESTLGSELLSPMYSGPDHFLSATERGMLSDMGWTVAAVPEAGAFILFAGAACVASAGAAFRRRRMTSDAV
jgi:hypothetical protein